MIRIPSLKKLDIKVDGQKIYFQVDSFIQELRSCNPELKKKLKRSNILRELKHKNDGDVQQEDGTYTSFQSIVRFCFQHVELHFCNQVCEEILSNCVDHDEEPSASDATAICSEEEQTLFNLYLKIAESETFFPATVQYLQSNLVDDIENLVKEAKHVCLLLKDSFTNIQWVKICLFERQFVTYQAVNEEYGGSALNRMKWQFYNFCQSLHDSCGTVQNFCDKTVRRNSKRKYAGNVIDQVTIELVDEIHRPDVLETLVAETCCESSNIQVNCVTVVPCLDVTCDKCAQLGVHIFIELAKNTAISCLQDCSVLIQAEIRLLHNSDTCEIVFVDSNCLSSQIKERFAVRDKYYLNKLADKVVYVHKFGEDDDLLTQNNHFDAGRAAYCKTCFSTCVSAIDTPMRVKDFNIEDEWLLHTPLPLQIVLEKIFINKNSVKRSKLIQSFLRTKVSQLYHLLDSGLNIYNKNYTGFLQEINTDELLINHHSTATVFSVSCQSGCTKSLSAAEAKLKALADPDLCYYNTYVKKHPMLYKSVSDSFPVLHHINLRQCHIILYVDNLVRFSSHTDPKPGECVTTQLCTLPITVKRVPKDSAIAQSWHTAQCSTQGSDCSCKEKCNFEAGDFERYITQCLPAEEQQWKNFHQTSTWGICQYYNQLLKPLIRSFNIVPTENLNHSNLESDISNTGENRCIEEMQGPSFEEFLLFNEGLEGSFSSLSVESDDQNVQSTNTLVEGTLTEDDDLHYELPSVQSSLQENATSVLMEANSTAPSAKLTLDTFNYEGDISTSFMNLSVNDETVDESAVIKRSCDLICESLSVAQEHSSFDLKPTSYAKSFESVKEHDADYEFSRTSQSESASGHNLLEVERMPSQAAKDTPTNMKDVSAPNQVQNSIPLLCRHPPPHVGRDDNIEKLRDVLDDCLIQSGTVFDTKSKDRVLLAPDHKIARNLFTLMNRNTEYRKFLPEFPLLHLRKSKIGNFFKAYKEAGILKLLSYMRDEDSEKELGKLVSVNNIEKATRSILRLSIALHASFLINFWKNLPAAQILKVHENLSSGIRFTPDHQHVHQYEAYVHKRCEESSTFLLHFEIMNHADEIVVISLAERTSGADGYDLLLASVKRSLPFVFLNGSTSYAQFCLQLLQEHYSAGPFHTNLKKALFSTPHKDSLVNFALDTQREIDHRDALKAFRPGSSLTAIIPRMSVVDHLSEIHKLRKSLTSETPGQNSGTDTNDILMDKNGADNYLGISITETDFKHAIRGAAVILKRSGLSKTSDTSPCNVYSKDITYLPESILDEKTFDIGNYLIKKFASKEKMFGLNEKDIPNLDSVSGPSVILAKLKNMKGVTLNRISSSRITQFQTQREKREVTRKKKIKRELKRLECLSSDKNTCQAVLRPDCSKSSTNKSAGMKRALAVTFPPTDGTDHRNLQARLGSLPFVFLDTDVFPASYAEQSVISLVEFAGFKFRSAVSSGKAYIDLVSSKFIQPLLLKFPKMRHIVICEEKYSFTPDDFKSSARSMRSNSQKYSLEHLQDENEILDEENFRQIAITGSSRGKIIVSTYLAANLADIKVNKEVMLDVDSELVKSVCTCQTSPCSCERYCVPVRAIYKKGKGLVKQEYVTGIHQKKGEAEMAQADWLLEIVGELNEGDAVLNIVTSGDIDAIPIHLVAVSLHWPRNEDGTFRYPLRLLLQKANKKMDLYDMTSLIQCLENQYPRDKHIALKIAIVLSMGGNDFLPRYHGFTHEKLMQLFLQNEQYLQELLHIEEDPIRVGQVKSCTIDKDVYVHMISTMYCPLKLRQLNLSFDEIRQLTISRPCSGELRHPQTWLPPKSALEKIAGLIQSQIEYILTVCHPTADLPDFIQNGGLIKDEEGNVEYDLGHETHVNDPMKDLLSIPEELLASKTKLSNKDKTGPKRVTEVTPQRLPRPKKKRHNISTPKKLQWQMQTERSSNVQDESLDDIQPLHD